MNNTALRAEAQSANNTHMVFVNEEHEEFFYEKLEQAKSQDCHHKALIYVLGISEDTRKYFNQIYDIKTGNIKRECLHQGWLSSGGVVVIRLAFNLYTDTTPSANDYKSKRSADRGRMRCSPAAGSVFQSQKCQEIPAWRGVRFGTLGNGKGHRAVYGCHI